MNRKLLLITMLSILAFSKSFAQQLTPEVIASSGEYFSRPTVSLSWTIGEDFTETFIKPTAILTQGFQQPIPEFYNDIAENTDNNQFLVFPNPSVNQINISFSTLDPITITINLYDGIGRLIKSEITNTAVTPYSLDISRFAANCYFLTIQDNKDKLLYKTLILKP